MKKALVILLTLAMVGAAFAEDVVAPTISGGVSATWGYSLELEAGGFKNDSDVVVTFPFAAFGDKSNSGEGMWGEVKVEDFGLSIDNDTMLGIDTTSGDNGVTSETETNGLIEGGDYSVTGIIHFNENVGLTIYDVPSLGYNYAVNYKADDGDTLSDINTDSDWIGGGVGLTLGYTSDMVTVELSTASKGDYDQDTVDAFVNDAVTPYTVTTQSNYDGADTNLNADNLYMYSAFVSLKPAEMLTVNGAFTMIPEDYTFPGISINAFNVQAIVAVAPLTITVGSDVVMSSDPIISDVTTAYDFSADVSYAVADGFDVALNAWAVASDTEVESDMPLNVKFVATEDLATGFVPSLGAVVEFGVDNVLGDETAGVAANDSDLDWYTSVEVSYLLVAGLTATAEFGYDYTEDMTMGAKLAMAPEFHKIANTTFTAEFADWETLEGESVNKGLFTLTAAIAF